MRIIQSTNNYTTPNFNEKKQNISKNHSSQIGFKGGEFNAVLNFLQTNQAWGAAAVDLVSMIIPRTAVDFTRSPEAGTETMRRECVSGLNNAFIGLYGAGIASLLALTFNKDFKANFQKMFISDEMIDVLGHTWDAKKGSANQTEEYLKHLLQNTQGFNPHIAVDKESKGWISIDQTTQDKFVTKMSEELKSDATELTKEKRNYFKALLATATGSESSFKITQEVERNGKKITIAPHTSADVLIDNIYKATKTFKSEPVAAEFAKDLKNNKFLSKIKNLNKVTAILGLGVAIAVGLSSQPVIAYLTKKKTGKAGFVGAEDQVKGDRSDHFGLLKTGVAVTALLTALATITTKKSEFMSKIQFKSKSPTLDQFKLVYGATIASRIMAARDPNELRETTFKDSLGFANWLLLGGFVSTITANLFDKMKPFQNDKLIRYNADENGKGLLKWLTKSHIVTREEVLYSAFKKAGISIVDQGKGLKFKEMYEVAKNTLTKNGVSKETETVLKAAFKKIKFLGFVQFAGYLYSGVVLGYGLPKLNIAMTKAAERKKKEQEAAQST